MFSLSTVHGVGETSLLGHWTIRWAPALEGSRCPPPNGTMQWLEFPRTLEKLYEDYLAVPPLSFPPFLHTCPNIHAAMGG